MVEALPDAGQTGVCGRCRDVIEWKKSYGKYKPLKQPAKCTGCGQKSVEHAYHTLCQVCSAARKVCAKCQELAPMPQATSDDAVRTPTAEELAGLSERQRRTALRKVEKAKQARKQAAKEAALQAATMEAEAEDEDGETEGLGEVAAVGGLPGGQTAHGLYQALADKGCGPSVCGATGAQEEACWSDRDQEGRTDDDDDGADEGDGVEEEEVRKRPATHPQGTTAMRLNADDDAAVAAVAAEAVTDDEDDEGEEGEESEEDEEGGSEDDDSDEPLL